MTELNPALAETPMDSVPIGAMRERLAIALSVHGAELAEEDRIVLASAISAPSPVVSIVSAYEVLSLHAASLGPVMLSRAIEAAEIIAAHSFHGKGDEASAFAAAARLNLAGA